MPRAEHAPPGARGWVVWAAQPKVDMISTPLRRHAHPSPVSETEARSHWTNCLRAVVPQHATPQRPHFRRCAVMQRHMHSHIRRTSAAGWGAGWGRRVPGGLRSKWCNKAVPFTQLAPRGHTSSDPGVRRAVGEWTRQMHRWAHAGNATVLIPWFLTASEVTDFTPEAFLAVPL